MNRNLTNIYDNTSDIINLKDKNNEKIIVIFKHDSIIVNNSNGQDEILRIDDFVKKVNSIASSKHIVDICKSIKLKNTSLMSYAAIEANKYKLVIRGDKKDFIYKYMINKINCDINPIINNKLKQSIAITKWKIYDFMRKREAEELIQGKYVDFDISIAYWVAILAGIYLYFDEKDELNFKQSSLLFKIYKPFNINSFK
jgi:hypothetical protein